MYIVLQDGKPIGPDPDPRNEGGYPYVPLEWRGQPDWKGVQFFWVLDNAQTYCNKLAREPETYQVAEVFVEFRVVEDNHATSQTQ